ncbi:penicillin-binding transpeptidase domain-containing protein [Propionibacteriaceae bacterium Y2011]
MRDRVGQVRVVAVVAAVVLALLGACTGSPQPPGPQRPTEPVAPLGQALAAALTEGSLADVPVDDPERAAAGLTEILRGMDGLRPEVTAGQARPAGEMVDVPLHLVWQLGTQQWTYDTVATFQPQDGAWVLRWDPTVLHPELTATTRLVHQREAAKRGRILGADNIPLADLLPVVRLGIDKSRMDADASTASAARLAQTLDLDVERYVARVRAAGEKAFVEAIVLRGRGEGVPDEFYDIPGALLLRDEWVLSTRRGRAEAVIGTVGDATAERVAESEGRIVGGDRVGLTGLQLRYDEQLRGVAGHTVSLASRGPANTPGASPSPSAPEASPSTSTEPRPLVLVDPRPGTDLVVSLDAVLQDRAEAVIAEHPSATAMAVVQPSTGAVLVLATNPAAEGQALANTGRFPPGSTFKVATALALLRAGMTAETALECTEFITVHGRRFKNYTDFPRDRLGTMTLRDAIATSCNTALISQHARLDGPQLREAAASLGVGVDHDSGFPAFYGSVPDPVDLVGLAAAGIGQGTVEASPMAMAGLTASVAAGRTVVPWLVESAEKPTPSGKPLTAGEAAALQSMMRAVVTSGTGRTLSSVAVGAKSGTAEYGTENPPRTHAWMIAYTDDDLAVAVMIHDGQSGSGDAAPLIKEFLA